MGKLRDWKLDGEKVGLNLISKEGDILTFEKDGFVFKTHRSGWPPSKVSPSQCETPTEYFKHQVRLLHGDTYDLTPTVFTGADNTVAAICNKHGEFLISAKYFKSIRGCPRCGDESAGLKSRSNTADFLEKVQNIHGTYYDYSLVVYETVNSLVKIICPVHGEFETTPERHLSGKGCRKCGTIRMASLRRLTQHEVLSRFIATHGDKYDYSKVNYKGDAHGMLSILCKEHGLFVQSYANHNAGKGCPTCAREVSARFKSGFIERSLLNGKACIYLIRCSSDSELFFKIGITTKDVSRRFAGKHAMPYDYEILHEYYSDGESVWNLEKVLHRYYKDVKYIPKLQFGGMYECFSEIKLSDYILKLY